MRIEQALAGCRALHDLPALIDALGGEPRYAELSPTAWLGAAAERAGIVAAAEIGRLDALPCIGILAQDARRAAERVLRATRQRGAPVFVVALGTRSLELTLGAGIDPPRLLDIDPDAPDGVAMASLRRVRGALGGGRAATAIRIGDRLGGERVDARFFTAFRESRDRLAAEGPADAPASDRSSLALLQLTRVLFLYFIQQKGWLDGRADFLARAVDAELARGRSVAKALLRPLFFGLLNRPAAQRGAATRRLGAIPFLNGGLFEPHPLERRWRFDHSNEAWRPAFDQLFEHFHFTLSERGDTASIAPDMLGRVFEGLMAPVERSATGTFYTPARVVDRIVSAGTASVLAERLAIGVGEAERRLASGDPGVGSALRTCRVLDLAVGSGAFLLGALELFARVRGAHDSLPGLRREILRRQLFGMDLSAEAVRLAELRLWLAAVQDDADGGIATVEPLPNLDATLRQGDTLKDPRWLAGLRRTPRATAQHLAAARAAFISESGAGKGAAWRRLRDAERAAAAEALGEGARDIEGRIATLLADARTPDLFGRPRGLDREGRGALREAREDLRHLRDAARRLRREGGLPWFDAQSCFGEVFAERGGFDLVVGNPPWVRAEDLPARDRALFAGRYRWWRGSGGRGFGHRPDLSVAFLERSFELCAPGGAVAMLVPAKLATAGYGVALRAHLSRCATLDHVVDLSASAADAFAAVTYPMMLVARRRAPEPHHMIAVNGDPPEQAPQASWDSAPWILRGTGAAQVARELLRRHPTLAEAVTIHLGVKSGCNAAFIDPPADVEREVVRLAVRGRDIGPFRVRSSVRLLYPHDRAGRPLPALPPAARRHLALSATALARRADAATGHWWSLHRTGPASAAHRVVWADLSRHLAAVRLPSRFVPLNSCYLAVAPDADAAGRLTAWLNSTWIGVLARLGADPARGGFARFNARTVGALPWPAAASRDRSLCTFSSDVPDVRSALDLRVAELLGLDAGDRRALRPLA